jgi:hypothetical protein
VRLVAGLRDRRALHARITPSASTPSSASTGAPHERPSPSTFRATPRRWPSAPSGARPSAAKPRARGIAVSAGLRNGSRGLFWLETLVEVATPPGASRTARCTPDDVAGLLDAGL